MPSYDFEVDLEALGTAAQGTVRTIELYKDQDVEDLTPSAGVLGSEVVSAAVAEFTGRWETGMNNLCEDIEAAAGCLGRIASNYAQFDQAGYEKLVAVATEVGGVRVEAD